MLCKGTCPPRSRGTLPSRVMEHPCPSNLLTCTSLASAGLALRTTDGEAERTRCFKMSLRVSDTAAISAARPCGKTGSPRITPHPRTGANDRQTHDSLHHGPEVNKRGITGPREVRSGPMRYLGQRVLSTDLRSSPAYFLKMVKNK